MLGFPNNACDHFTTKVPINTHISAYRYIVYPIHLLEDQTSSAQLCLVLIVKGF
jgi:hypothetical protein